jgi:F5/8 type C domain
LKWNLSAAKVFKIQTSSDGENWTDVYSTSQGSSNIVTDETFKTATARYVRMYGTERAPVIAGFRGRGRGQSGASTPPATQPATPPATPPALAPSRPSGYSLFDFMVLLD